MQDTFRNQKTDVESGQTPQESPLLQGRRVQVKKVYLLQKKYWISIPRAEYTQYDLEDALAELKTEMVRIIGSDGGEED